MMPQASLRTSSVVSASRTTYAFIFAPTTQFECSQISNDPPQIGEISLMKEMTTVATTMMSEEEKAELEKEMNGGVSPSGAPVTPPVAAGTTAEQPSIVIPEAGSATAPAAPTGAAPTTATTTDSAAAQPGALTPSPGPSPAPSPANGGIAAPTSPSPSDKGKKRAQAPGKPTPEQRKKLQALEDERRKTMEDRVARLTAKLIDRLRPFVDAAKPGDKDDTETQAFEARMKREADDLKLESFGVELLHTIGTIYMMKGSSFLKSKKFLGM
jgi:hypothetical protein